MNRLQRKCVIATAGIHLLLLTILIVGPAFYNPKSKTEESHVLDMISPNVIDAALNSGVRDATPPASAPAVTLPPPQPAPPTPVVHPTPPPPKPEPVVTPTPAPKVEKTSRPEPRPEPKPEPARTEPEKPATKPHQIEVNTKLVSRNTSKNAASRDNSQQAAKAIDNALSSLKRNLSSSTTINLPGDSDAASANYASFVKSVYDRAWMLPDTIAKDENITVKVTIASDGTVVSARVIERSGDAPADDSVQRALDRVTSIGRPFPAGSTDKERTYTIIFNPQIKSSE
ncbi:MAG TPA: TonB family protein [Verrucomicrobiae bacterium]|nr:TonB family protein [Verrucomicrobiae bacterium]